MTVSEYAKEKRPWLGVLRTAQVIKEAAKMTSYNPYYTTQSPQISSVGTLIGGAE